MRARLLKYDDMFYFYLTTPTRVGRSRRATNFERQMARAERTGSQMGGGVYYTELHYFTLHFWLFLCMV